MISKLGAPVSRCLGLLTRLEGLPILIVRVVLGIMFAQSGYGKLFGGHEKVTGYFTELGIPFPSLNAWFIGGVEFFGGILLIAGLATRVFAFLLSCTMLVATVTAVVPGKIKSDDYHNITDAFFLPEVLAMLLLVWMVFSGAGPASLDRLIAGKCSPPPEAKPAA
jgi:putative oxidoreductase